MMYNASEQQPCPCDPTANQEIERLRILHRATLAFNASLDLDKIFHSVLEELRHATQASGWSVWMLDAHRANLVCHQATGPGAEGLLDFSIPANLPLLRPLIENSICLYIPDTRKHATFDPRVERQRGTTVRSLICAPLAHRHDTGGKTVIGLIAVIGTPPGAFTDDECALLEALAASASVAIHNAELYRQARQEIDERRRAESALRESESHYRTLVETSADAVLLINLKGRIQMCNRRALELFNYNHPYEILERSYLSLFPPEYRARAMRGFELMLQGKTLHNAESTLLRGDGSLFEGEISAALAANNNGEPAQIVTFARDITDRKQVETAIRQHNIELRVLNDIGTQISRTQDLGHLLRTALDKTLNALDIDTGWMVLFDDVKGLRQDTPDEKQIYRGILAEPSIYERSGALRERVTRRARRTKQPVVLQAVELFELYVGSASQCQVVGVPLIVDNTVIGLMGVVGLKDRHPRHIHSRQEQLLLAIGYQISIAIQNARLAAEAAEVEMLRKLEKMRAELIANFSHDLKTPLGLIEMSISTVLRDDINLDEETQTDILRDVLSQTSRLAHLVEGILDLGRLEDGRLRLNLVPVDLGAMAQAVSADLQKRYPNHHFSLDTPQAALLVMADADRVEQVLYNLLDNAAKYSPDGGEVRITGSSDDRKIAIRIQDSGIGIPQDQLPFIFERFYRVEDAAAEGISGVGLGLPTCKGIVEAHGGDIWVQSTHGHGSTFAFILPVSDDLA